MTRERTADVAAEVVAILIERGLTIAVAESLTGGLLVSALVDVPGASAAVLGGVVAYNTAIKHSVLGVDAGLLAEHGPVDPEVARQMADRVRTVLAVGGAKADIGLSTTGVAGPGPQDGHPAGTVYLGFAIGEDVSSLRLELGGDRGAIRDQTVSESLARLRIALETR
ncbi:nicotinamide-nucleotide amidohydrolase family protein [Glaciihabitans sp. INWT7]|uniref:CinA family protein n=1 Tax=Glaciihabitans sp. INWT7 TaxID=2596912 RepID=UPI00162342DF|nr:nicotinamide-nucleotide amidohydrolase family protein [Glaciihabitans sp. INWT7]QNE46549.1 nicotinamide-nucleotide amidohydrolase family protein [Glaciihabitans sp. INWT7]